LAGNKSELRWFLNFPFTKKNFQVRANARTIIGRPLTADARVQNQVDFGFVVNKIVSDRFFLPVFSYFPFGIVPSVLHNHSLIYNSECTRVGTLIVETITTHTK